MCHLQQIVVNFFTKFIEQDPHTLEEISRFQSVCFFIDGSSSLVFSLLALHQFLCGIDTLNYAEFKKVIYQGDINKQLNSLGWAVEVHQSKGKVDKNTYMLAKLK